MSSEIKEIAEKFLSEEQMPVKDAMLLASLGLTKSVGDIAGLVYGVNFSEHPYNEERKKDMADYLGNALLNWHILAIASGFSGNEISARFAAEWLTKRTGKASINELLRHLKPNAIQDDTQDNEVY